MSDDLYLNTGESFEAYYPKEDTERKEKETKKAGAKAASYPILSDLAEWFEEAVKDCDNLDNIQTQTITMNGNAYERTVSIEAQVLAYQLLKQKLQEKYLEFQEFKKERKK